MREVIAKCICLLALAASVTAAAIFAVRQNPGPDAAEMPARAAEPAPREPAAKIPEPGSVSLGRKVFEEQKCFLCHSIGGVGSSRNPLDDAGSRPPEDLRDWITGRGAATNFLSASVLKRKQRYNQIPEDQMDAMVHYLDSLGGSAQKPPP
jgi:mono/diheme cytochrome c family protein